MDYEGSWGGDKPGGGGRQRRRDEGGDEEHRNRDQGTVRGRRPSWCIRGGCPTKSEGPGRVWNKDGW